MNRLFIVIFACAALLISDPANAGGKKELVKSAVARLLARDAARDAATVAVPAAESRMVWRYTARATANREMKSGIAAGSHFTPKINPGRPPSSLTAQRQYGLPKPPQVRMTVRISEGRPVLKNKALGGKPGKGEIVNAEPLPPGAVRKITKLPRK